MFQAFSSQKERINPQIKEVLRYREAVWYGYNQLQKKSILTTNLLIELCQIIRQSASVYLKELEKAGILKNVDLW